MKRADLSARELWVCHLGTIPYRDAVLMQEGIRTRRQAGELPDTLLLLEHPPVYTRGRRSVDGELPLGEDFYRERDIEIVPTDRGGRITYHGPGQLVGYPIMAIEAVDRYLRTMEEAIVMALAEEGVEARSRPGEGPDYTGVWVEDRKIASIGVHVSRGVTTHGFAVNVDNDLEPFSWVVACGLPGVSMTSLARERELSVQHGEMGSQRTSGLACVRKRVAHSFCRVHGRRQRLVSPAWLKIQAPIARAGIGPRETIAA
ncbi:MAG TPA: lipoyl(octanoyl) transferase LipB [Solirubrobacteraceae bacterium]|jgi:lipoyl(octanoyl) transferase